MMSLFSRRKADPLRHIWRFERVGGFDQVLLESGADLVNLEELDPKLWTALSCPVKNVAFDPRTLELIDTDKDGRIRVPEILAALRWALSRIVNPDSLFEANSELPFPAIREDDDEGKRLLSAARWAAMGAGRSDATSISVGEASDAAHIFAQNRFNGDGIVPEKAAEDDETKALIRDILACLPPETDRSGAPGVSKAMLEKFFAQAESLDSWWQRAEQEQAGILFLGENTDAAMSALEAVSDKIEEFFARQRLASFDPRTESALTRAEEEYAAEAAKDLYISQAELEKFPIARPNQTAAMPLDEGVNPAWRDRVNALREKVVESVLGERPSLSESDWRLIQSRFAPYQKWRHGRPAVEVEKLGLARVRAILAGSGREAINDLITRDKAVAFEADAIISVEKLARYYRDLVSLLNNFVCFRDFYDRSRKAIFQAGTLFLDGRSCDLCLVVTDPARHAALAGQAKTYLAYCDCVRPADEKMAIVAAVTAGDADRLMAGRNGIFIDRSGRDWEATITSIVDNPISVAQAFVAPYKRIIRMLEEQVARRAASAEAERDKKLAATADAAAQLDKQSSPAVPQKIDTGTVAALGVAVGAIGTAISALVTGLLKLPAWQMPLVLLGLILAVSGPSMVIAALKLRQRNLGPILDASGWAVNARTRISIPFGRSLTSVATLPRESRRVADADARKTRKWLWTALALALSAFLASLVWTF